MLQQTGGGRENEVGRGRADDDEFDLADVDASGIEGRARSALGEVGRGLAFRGDVALADAGAGVDPFVGRVDELLQLRVGQDLLRQIAAGACDTGMNQSGFPPASGPRGPSAESRGLQTNSGACAPECRIDVMAGWRPRRSVFGVDRGLARDHLAAAVVAVLGDVVTNMDFARRRVGGQLLGRKRIVRTAHAAGRRGLAGFLNCHGNSPKTRVFACRRR
jgi:hypothetical protein